MNKLQKLSEELLNKAIKAGDGEADVKMSYGWETEISFEQDKLKSITASESAELNLRLVSRGKLGVAATNKMIAGGLDEVVSEAVGVAEFGHKAGFKLPIPGRKEDSLKTYDHEVEKLTESELVEKGQEMIALVKKEVPGMMVNYLGFSYSSGGEHFINSNQVETSEKSTGNSFGIEISRMIEGDFFQVWRGKSSVRADIDYQMVVNEVINLAKKGNKIIKPAMGLVRVVFTPEVFRDLLSYLLTAANGKLVNEGVSKFVGKQGAELFDKQLTLYEDPRLDWGLASTLFDDEGVPTIRKDIVREGVVAGFYYDLMQAAKAGVKPTGNGFRSAYTQASPGITNLVAETGNQKLADLIAGESEVLVVHQVLGAGQNNPYNGDFQFGVNLGYVWRKGEVVGRVKDTALAGNIFSLLKSKLVWLSKDTEWVGASKLPYVCLDGVVGTN